MNQVARNVEAYNAINERPSIRHLAHHGHRKTIRKRTFNASMPVNLRCLCWSLMMMNGVPNSSKPNEPGMKDMVDNIPLLLRFD